MDQFMKAPVDVADCCMFYRDENKGTNLEG